VHPECIETFCIDRIVDLYENTVPQMYQKLDMLANAEDTQPLYLDLKHKLAVIRVELLKTFHHCLQTCVNAIVEKM
jgi:hypothetical protein